MLGVPQLQFVFRGWDFPAATQRQVSTVHTPRSGAALGTVHACVVWRWTGGGGGRRWQAALSACRPGVGAHHTGGEPM